MEQHFEKWAKDKGLSQQDKEEVLRALNMGKIMVSKPLISYLTQAIEYKQKYDAGVDQAKCKKALKLLRRQPVHNFTGYIQMDIKEEGVGLRMQVCLTDRNHEIMLRSDGYLTASLQQIDKMTDMVLAYYQNVMRDEELCECFRAIFGDTADKLTLNKFDRTMFVYDGFEKRLGVLCFYVDSKGQVIQPTERDTVENGAPPTRDQVDQVAEQLAKAALDKKN